MKRAAAVLGFLLSVLMLADALLTGAAQAQTAPGIVLVQERQQGPGIFRFLFGNRRQPQGQPRILRRLTPDEMRRESRQPRQREAARPRRQQQQREAARPRQQREASRPRRERRARPAAPVPREVAAVEKAENAKRVLVVGDFMAAALSKGLADAYAENPNVVVIDASSGSSGLVRADHYDWPGQLPALVQAEKADAVLVVVGANDRQGIDTETGPQALGSDGWRAAYGARVAAFADVLKGTGKPVLWAGLAPARASAMSRDYSAMNGIVREQLEAKGIRFIETWNGFADEEGRFTASGPDIGGQTVQLRDSDGLNFTRAGQRKLAFFVEGELTEILGGAAPQLASVDPAAMDPGALPPPDAAQGPSIGPMVPIDALTAGGDALSGAPVSPEQAGGAVVTTISKRLAGEEASAPPDGRVDQYAWPPPSDAPTVAAGNAVVLPPPPVPPLAGPPPALLAPPASAAPASSL
jgi:hypothetical protein